jgi:hypothetical protein
MLRSYLAVLAFGTYLTLAQYVLTDTFNGDASFWGNFDFFTAGDPTDGWTSYVNYSTAVQNGLIGNSNVATWGVDHTTVLDPTSGTGRQSIRITSQKTWTHGLFVADIKHMPNSICGTWPAYWLFGQDGTWPHSGEVDIIEGVNNGNTNLISAHTSPNCTIAGSGQLGTLETNDCAVSSERFAE